MAGKRNVSEKYFSEAITELNADLKESLSLQIKDSINSLRETIIDNLVKENQRLKKKITFLTEEVDVLYDKMHEVELGLNDQQQRSRRSNIEICGIPNDVSDESLEENCIKILNEIVESPLNSTEINACHRLPGRGNKPTIIMQFTGRKRRDDIIKNSRKACNINSTRLGLPEGNKIYI